MKDGGTKSKPALGRSPPDLKAWGSKALVFMDQGPRASKELPVVATGGCADKLIQGELCDHSAAFAKMDTCLIKVKLPPGSIPTCPRCQPVQCSHVIIDTTIRTNFETHDFPLATQCCFTPPPPTTRFYVFEHFCLSKKGIGCEARHGLRFPLALSNQSVKSWRHLKNLSWLPFLGPSDLRD